MTRADGFNGIADITLAAGSKKKTKDK